MIIILIIDDMYYHYIVSYCIIIMNAKTLL